MKSFAEDLAAERVAEREYIAWVRAQVEPRLFAKVRIAEARRRRETRSADANGEKR